jgi:7-cyano-7-deazaguanine synthase
MSSESATAPIGLLLSGGLDSCILLGHLMEAGHRVRPFYIRSELNWEAEELRAVTRLLEAVRGPRLEELVVLDLPLTDLYADHWSLSGRGVPGAATEAEAVYLPGRNLLLTVKAALWCRLHGIDRLALAVLRSNPFSDASPGFFADLESALDRATGGRVRIIRPFAPLDKLAVMHLGRELPLGLTFSCIAPVGRLHCGQCNKCAERRDAFALLDTGDPTAYAAEDPRAAEKTRAAAPLPQAK